MTVLFKPDFIFSTPLLCFSWLGYGIRVQLISVGSNTVAFKHVSSYYFYYYDKRGQASWNRWSRSLLLCSAVIGRGDLPRLTFLYTSI